MRSVKRPILFNLLIGLALAVTSCNLPSRLANEAATSTAAAQTLQAQLTLFAPTTAAPPTFPVVTTVPPPTQSPSSTPVIPTATSSCDIAQFVTDVTYTDGTIVPAGQAFTKTWRFRNSGNCS